MAKNRVHVPTDVSMLLALLVRLGYWVGPITTYELVDSNKIVVWFNWHLPLIDQIKRVEAHVWSGQRLAGSERRRVDHELLLHWADGRVTPVTGDRYQAWGLDLPQIYGACECIAVLGDMWDLHVADSADGSFRGAVERASFAYAPGHPGDRERAWAMAEAWARENTHGVMGVFYSSDSSDYYVAEVTGCEESALVATFPYHVPEEGSQAEAEASAAEWIRGALALRS